MVFILGVCVALASGLVENRVGEVAIPEKRFYGLPLAWRGSDPFVGEGYRSFELFVDCVIWIFVVLVIAWVAAKPFKD